MEKEKGKNYTVSIIDSGEIKNISLNDFKKDKISFGRSTDNDIVIASPIVSSHHGYFLLIDDGVYIYDNKSKNGIFINNVLLFDGCKIGNNDTIKIDNIMEPLNEGILMVINEGKSVNNWKTYDLSKKDEIIIGRSKKCDIVLDRVSVSLNHAKILKKEDNYYLSSFGNQCGVIIDNNILNTEIVLREKDVFIINDTKLIYNSGKIIYQTSDHGVKLEAIDIVKTVKIKGKKKNIADHIDFQANPGEFIAFVGGSGAGKSTFMKAISGVVKPTSGSVLINGSELYNNYSVLKNLIGYVPQDNIIYDDLTLFDMLKYAANLRMPEDASRKEKLKRIDDVLEIVELLDKKDVMIKNLSGGQQKRACIAVELIADPKLFFLDEPTSGLDPGTERSLMKTLRKMASSGKTIILVTHNTLNLHLCDKVVFFGYGGKLCFDGKPSDALEFFKVDDFTDVYNEIDENPDNWKEAFKKSKYKVEVKNSNNNEKINSNNNTNDVREYKGFVKQFVTLTLRRFKLLFNNKQQLLMLFGQAPLLAFLLNLVVTDDLFYSYEETKSIMFTLSNAGIWLGLLNSIQEICKEKVILHKEYMADMRLSAYILSKVIYLIIVGLIQSLLLVGTFSLLVGNVPELGLTLNWIVEVIVIVFITTFTSSAMGLVVSAFSKDSSFAMTMPTLLIIPQMLFSGILFPLGGIVDKLSNLTICRWSVEALGTVNDLNSLVSDIQEAIPGYVRGVESFFEYTLNHLTHDIFMMIIMSLIFIFSSYFILRYQLESGK